jgi:putative FmdB family regulatory protein
MPLFVFKCQTCLKVIERIVSSDVKVVECPECSGAAEKQLTAPGGFNLQGEGWYKGNAKPPVEK